MAHPRSRRSLRSTAARQDRHQNWSLRVAPAVCYSGEQTASSGVCLRLLSCPAKPISAVSCGAGTPFSRATTFRVRAWWKWLLQCYSPRLIPGVADNSLLMRIQHAHPVCRSDNECAGCQNKKLLPLLEGAPNFRQVLLASVVAGQAKTSCSSIRLRAFINPLSQSCNCGSYFANRANRCPSCPSMASPSRRCRACASHSTSLAQNAVRRPARHCIFTRHCPPHTATRSSVSEQRCLHRSSCCLYSQAACSTNNGALACECTWCCC